MDDAQREMGSMAATAAFAAAPQKYFLGADAFGGESAEESLSEQVGRLARDQVARRANETTSHNVGRDSKKGARFARVPMGGHTCMFCMMLASRGFVYHTEKTAGEFGHYHSDCRCKVVAGFEGASVEGYDPARLSRAWRRMEEIDGRPDLTQEQRRALKEAVVYGDHLQLSSKGDPAKEYYGPITDVERADFDARCGALGVKVVESSGESIEFQPKVGDYPPQIRIPKDASLLAHRHELDHAEYDHENGNRGMAFYMMSPDIWAKMEQCAYGIEIAQAESDGYTELADRLRANLQEEVGYIEARYGRT